MADPLTVNDGTCESPNHKQVNSEFPLPVVAKTSLDGTKTSEAVTLMSVLEELREIKQLLQSIASQ